MKDSVIRVVGFSGSRHGMTDAQDRRMFQLLPYLKGVDELHHGDCVGADERMHLIWRAVLAHRTTVHVHPPKNSDKRANVSESSLWRTGDVEHPPAHYLERNEAIVVASDVLIATPSLRVPPNPQRTGRGLGGTWWTVLCACQMDKPVIVVLPCGELLIRAEGEGDPRRGLHREQSLQAWVERQWRARL